MGSDRARAVARGRSERAVPSINPGWTDGHAQPARLPTAARSYRPTQEAGRTANRPVSVRYPFRYPH